MSEANARLDEIMANPSFRKVFHIIGTVAFGYILLMLTLFILDTTNLGTTWLETHQDMGFFIIILILISLLFLMDHAISYARRYYGEEKNSIIDVGLTVAISNIEKYESKSPETFKPLIQKILTLSSTKENKPPEIVEPRSRIIAPELSSLSQKYQKKEPASTEVAVEPVKQKPVEIPAPTETPPVVAERVMKKERPVIKKEGAVREFLKELIKRSIARPEKTHKEVTDQLPIPAPIKVESNKSSSLEDMIQSRENSEAKPGTSEVPELSNEIIEKSRPEIYDDSNVIFSNTIPILIVKGKRMIKAFETNHSITVIDFKSKVTQRNVELTIESLNAPSQEAEPVKEGLVYEYNNIHINLENENIEKAVVRFKVRRDWILKNNINIMQLLQYIHDDWTVLPAEVIGQDARYLFFEVYVPSFSLPFAIVGI
jgi:PGF-pre-PGF domain-containing protein